MRLLRLGVFLARIPVRYNSIRTVSTVTLSNPDATKMTVTDADSRYRIHLLPDVPGSEQGLDTPEEDWTLSLDLERASDMATSVFGTTPLRVLVLYGSLRERSVPGLASRFDPHHHH